MIMQAKKWILLPIALLPLLSACAQSLQGTIRVKTLTQISPDSGAKIYLCHRVPQQQIDYSKISAKEKVVKEYELSLTGSARQMSKHIKVLAKEYGINEKAGFDQYLADAANEEAKLISAKDVQIRIADSAGYYKFTNITEGNYFVVIKSGNSNKSWYASIDIEKHSENYLDRVID